MKFKDTLPLLIVVFLLFVALHVWMKQMEILQQMELRLAALVPAPIPPIDQPKPVVNGFAGGSNLA
jgi:hypothetical protein